MKIVLFLFLAFLQLFITSQTNLQCLNAKSEAVDWFLIFKMPQGLDYYYCDSDECSELLFINSPLNDPNDSPLFNTLSQIETVTSDSYGTLFWNDENPTSLPDATTIAHAKGIIGFDSSYGFIISHSVPLFPEFVSSGKKISLDFPESEQVYAQSLMCISTTTNDIEAIAAALKVDHPGIIGGNIPDSLSASNPTLVDVLNKVRDTDQQSLNVKFHTTAGKQFYKIAKSKDYNTSFYEDVLRTELGTGMLIETWGHVAGGLLPADCESDETLTDSSILDLNFGNDNVFKYTSDHSKYAVSITSSRPWFCISDINRVKQQFTRGGGAYCLNQKDVYTAVNKIIVDYQNCTDIYEEVYEIEYVDEIQQNEEIVIIYEVEELF